MQLPSDDGHYARLVAWLVIVYGLVVIVGSLAHQLEVHGRHTTHGWLLTLPGLAGLGYLYLGGLLLRLKRNAWLTAIAWSVGGLVLNALLLLDRHEDGLKLQPLESCLHLALPLLLLLLLLAGRRAFRVRSDRRGFRRAAWASAAVLVVTLLYGILGFTLLDRHDFHQEVSPLAAAHQTIDQFGLTTPSLVPRTVRARLFTDSLSAISAGALLSVILAFFQPMRFQLRPQQRQRAMAQALLQRYPSDPDDYFKLWPHDKQYFFDDQQQSGLAYRVSRGVALVVGDPFGNPKRFLLLLQAFEELCFVNDWRPAFIHVSQRHRDLYEKLGYHLQKVGEEALLDVAAFQAVPRGKYFRQIHNRFTRLGYHVELLDAPHDTALLARLSDISAAWLQRPGRAERGFMLGSFSPEYLQRSRLAVVRDQQGQVRGFMNLVPTFAPATANYDLLRCDLDAPGNCNDFLLLGLIDQLHAEGVRTLNLGLCPLKGLEGAAELNGPIDGALRFIYANGDRFYSFSGLQRFKAKYHPRWEGRSVAYQGNPAHFARVMTALTRAMKVR